MNGGHVYVIAFDNGTVKIGRTRNALKRMSDHRRDGWRFGIAFVDSWVSPLHAEWGPNEGALKSIAVRHGGTPARPGAEYFMGADYARVIRAAKRLTFTPPGESEGRPSGPESVDPVTVDPRKVWMKRIRAGLCANDLARLAGLNSSYVRLIERGKRNPSRKTLDALAKALNCEIADLLSDDTTVADTQERTAA